MPYQHLFFWGNLEAEGGASFTLQGSTAPSRGQLRFRLGYTPAAFADLRITNGSDMVLLAGCRIVREAIVGGRDGRWREVTVEDRRWRWRAARIWGKYNLIEGNVIVPRTKLSARQLGEKLMAAIGETSYDLSQLPTDSFPLVDWDAEPAAGALETLLQQYGLMLAPLRSGTWVAFKIGQGPRPAVDQRAMEVQLSREPAVVPDRLIFEGGPTLWQWDLPLVPVGVESTSAKAALVDIDKLSYKPAAGWAGEDPRVFYGVEDKKRELAKRCVWRYYRIDGDFQLPVPPAQLPNGGKGGVVSSQQQAQLKAYYKIDSDKTWRIEPLEAKQLSLFKGPNDTENPDAQIVGYFCDTKHGWNNNKNPNAQETATAKDKNKLIDTSQDETLIYQGSFQIDAERRLVVFSEPMFFFGRTANKNTQWIPALIRLRTSFGLLDPDSRAQLCQQYWATPPFPSRQGFVELVKRPEYMFEIGPTSTTNAQDYITQAQLCLQEALPHYYQDDAMSVTYKGFVFDQPLSGAIKCVSWSVSSKGEGTTQVDYLTDRPDLRMSARDLQARVQAVGQLQAARQAKQAAAVAARKPKRRPIQ